jgi:SAM-dependent methyltransferase
VIGLSAQATKELIEFALSENAPKTHHVTRLFMYRAMKDALAERDTPAKKALCISGSNALADILGLKKTVKVGANYPEHNLISLGFDEGAFDFCISDQVLEHVEGSPFDAFKESARVIKPGGYIIHTTCFANEVHGAPSDFWRFTPEGLELLARHADCEPVLSGGWGNKEAFPYMAMGFRMRPIPDNPQNPIYKLAMRNDPGFPIVTWVVARKSIAD